MAYNTGQGFSFEILINDSNLKYRHQRRAVIHKRPTPVKIMSNKMGRVTGFVQPPIYTDYGGQYRQRGIEFEAKSVADGRFPFDNITEQQVNFLSDCHFIGAGICFVLIEFRLYRTTILIPFPAFWDLWEARNSGRKGCKSISFETAMDVGHAVGAGAGGLHLDYLAVVDRLWFQPIRAGGHGA